jgi:uncharacterized sulfatase
VRRKTPVPVTPALDRRTLLTGLGAGSIAASLPAQPRRNDRPNVILICADDLGWGDLGCYGSPFIRTPQLDRLAKRGVRMTDFYASANVCTPSRAGLLTGRYPIRTGLAHEVIQVKDSHGLPLSEITIAEMLKPGYATLLTGKWHLGHTAPAWPPMRHGFDAFAGIPYSNDMRPLPFYRSRQDGSMAEEPAVQERLTRDTFDAAIAFAAEPRDRPFFIAIMPAAPHIPLRPAADYAGRSEAGRYGDVVEELDSHVGRLVAALEKTGKLADTLILFTSDNGPWFEGSAGPAQGRKGGAGWDGGYLVPLIAHWPRRLKPRVSDAIAMNIDLLPTIAEAAGAALPKAEIDGRSLLGAWRNGGPGPHSELILFNNERVAALRTPRWKYVVRSYYRSYNIPLAKLGYPLLFDVMRDPGETLNLAARHPQAAADLQRRFVATRDRFEPMGLRQVPDNIPGAS